MWRLPWISGYSYPRVTVIRIDVHPAGENLINMTRTLPTPVHVRNAYASCGWSPYVTTFHADPTELDIFTAPDSSSQPGWAVYRTHLSFSPNTAIEAVRLSQTSIDEHAARLTGPISPACDQYVQYLLTGANPSVVNRHRRELHPCMCRFSNTTPRPSQPTVLHFPPNGPAQSQVINY
jgi:hypothetical protein